MQADLANNPEHLAGRARLLLTDGDDPESIHLDVTNKPGESPVSDPARSRFEAINAGRLAVDQETRAQWSEASLKWKTCADLWLAAERSPLAALAAKRAGLAERAAGRLESAARLEQLAHELADALAEPWVFEHMGRLRPRVPPFDADLLD